MTDGSAPKPGGTDGSSIRHPQVVAPGPRAGAVREPGLGTGARPTLDEVARHAGVGRGTASRVLNDSPQVSPRARSAVLASVEALGYVANPAARSLVTRRTDTVALVVSEVGDRLFGEPFFAATVRGISERLSASPYQLLLAMSGSERDRARVAAYLTDQRVDGVLLLSLHADDDLPERLEARGVPTVVGGRPPSLQPTCVVDVENRAGGALAVEHLVGMGRRRIGIITGPQDMTSGSDRLEGALAALAEAGVDPARVPLATGDYSERSGELAMRQLLEGEPLDAVFAGSDLMAAGALRVLREFGVGVPDEIAVIGFDNAPVCRHTQPELSTVAQPVEEMGARMADLLIDRLAGRAVPALTLLPTHLVVRSSTWASPPWSPGSARPAV